MSKYHHNKLKGVFPTHVQAGNANRRDDPCEQKYAQKKERILSDSRIISLRNLAFSLVLLPCLKIRNRLQTFVFYAKSNCFFHLHDFGLVKIQFKIALDIRFVKFRNGKSRDRRCQVKQPDAIRWMASTNRTDGICVSCSETGFFADFLKINIRIRGNYSWEDA